MCVCAAVGRRKVVGEQQIEARKQRHKEEQTHALGCFFLQCFYALGVEYACDAVRTEEYRSVQDYRKRGYGDDCVA